eukprot:2709452-Pleurochrysis_carterae.AAC.1
MSVPAPKRRRVARKVCLHLAAAERTRRFTDKWQINGKFERFIRSQCFGTDALISLAQLRVANSASCAHRASVHDCTRSK